MCAGSVKTTSFSCSVPTPFPVHLTQQTIKASRRTNLSRHLFPLPITNICHHIHTILFCVTQPASVPSHTPSPPNAPPWYPSQKRLQNAAKTEIITQEHVTTLPSQYHSPIHTVLLSATQPALISSHTSPTHNTYSLILVSQPASISPYTHPTHSTYHLILRDPTSVDLLTYTTPLTIHTTSFSYPNLRQSPHIRIPLSVHTTLFSATQPVLISSHTPPTHSQYIQPLSRVPTGVLLPTYTLPLLFSLPTNTVRGRGCVEFEAIHVCVLICAFVCVSVYAGVPTFQ